MNNQGIVNIHGIPPEAKKECREFFEEFKKKHEGIGISTIEKIEMNSELEEFEQYLKEKYPTHEITCRLDGELAFHKENWSVDKILDVYKKVYPERYKEDKKRYTRIEINNILFDLQLEGILGGYESVAVPLTAAKSYNDETFCGSVEVLCRFNY